MEPKNYVSFRDLYMTDFEITDLFAMRQKWVKNVEFRRPHPRQSTGIIFLKGCCGEYIPKSGKRFFAPSKSLVCLPAGSEYTCVNLDCDSTISHAFLVEFNAISNGRLITFSDSPFLINDVNIPIAADLCEKVLQAYEATIQSPLALKSAVYRLLAHLGKENLQKHQKHFLPIIQGIEIIEENPLSNLSIEDIAGACNISSCYFRKLFHEYAGKSPIQYRMDLRLDMAKKMLENGDSTLEYIAEAVGFENASYFCRLFKNKTGITAGQYRKLHKSDIYGSIINVGVSNK